eukprot:CAMPEP_0168524174 /NCGR_PEP_ID=MMETSP0405-20121227/10476_1 /TAXON_ID=498012 /ORGANISM="Trichosphaerium sp, Strain Am-I-7 wt" /LENGTH=242 /DNA_ID=CAMNT_0008546297 /DNA_START=237 /DNA_END=964 /DNA_ORIENTATION=-
MVFPFVSADAIEVNGVIDRLFDPLIDGTLKFFRNPKCQKKEMAECWSELLKLYREMSDLFATELKATSEEYNKELLKSIVKQFRLEIRRRQAQYELIMSGASTKKVQELEKPPQQRKSYQEHVEELKESAKRDGYEKFSQETLEFLNEYYSVNPTDYNPYGRLNEGIHAFEKKRYVGTTKLRKKRKREGMKKKQEVKINHGKEPSKKKKKKDGTKVVVNEDQAYADVEEAAEQIEVAEETVL